MDFINSHFNTLEINVLIIFGIALIIQLFYILFIFFKFVTYKPKVKRDTNEPVSVVICAQNEEHNLKKLLPSILNQSYPDFEVIVVDDCSTDNTADVLAEMKLKYNNLKVTFINKDDKFTHGKKLALTVGIKGAKNEWLLLTDADCEPVSENWIKTMAQNFTKNTSVVLGYGGYFRKRSLLNNLIRFDTLFISVQYFSLTLKGKPYMGVGRNLAYRKSLFFKNRGFASHYQLLSGDDDLFVNEVAKKNNTKVEFRYESITRSVPCKTFRSWIKQKNRHFKTGFYYDFGTKFILSLEVLSRIIFYSFFIIFLIISKTNYIYLLPLFLFRIIFQLIVIKKAINRFKEKNLLISSLFYDFIFPFINFIFIAVNLFSSDKNKWK